MPSHVRLPLHALLRLGPATRKAPFRAVLKGLRGRNHSVSVHGLLQKGIPPILFNTYIL